MAEHKRTEREEIHEIPGGGDLPVMPNFEYQPSSATTPDENTTSVDISFEPKPGETGWTWTAWAANFASESDASRSTIPVANRGFTRKTSLVRGTNAYFGVYVKCTKAGQTDETLGTLYSWADGTVQGDWNVTLENDGTELGEHQV